MTPDRPTSPPSRPGRTEPWRIERMVQRVPAHLGENTREPVSPWIVIAGVVLLILVSCGVLFVLIDVPSRLAGLGFKAQPTATRTPRVVTPGVTILPPTPAPATPTAGPTAVTTKYKVKAGDTLSSISARYHVSIEAIKTANGMTNDTVRIGDELTIPLPTPTPPGGASIPQLPASTPTAISLQSPPSSDAPAATPGVVRYTVSRGDTLISIAAAYGSSVDAIRLANQLPGDFLSVGQVLQVPLEGWTPTVVATAVAMVSPTPTAQFTYRAPNLTWPPDNQALRGSGGAPSLEWSSPASLKPSEFYVLHIDYTVNGTKKSIVKQIKQGNSYSLTAADYPGPNASGTEFSWYVLIVNSGPSSSVRAEAPNPQVFASSPPSETRTFIWY